MWIEKLKKYILDPRLAALCQKMPNVTILKVKTDPEVELVPSVP